MRCFHFACHGRLFQPCASSQVMRPAEQSTATTGAAAARRTADGPVAPGRHQKNPRHGDSGGEERQRRPSTAGTLALGRRPDSGGVAHGDADRHPQQCRDSGGDKRQQRRQQSRLRQRRQQGLRQQRQQTRRDSGGGNPRQRRRRERRRRGSKLRRKTKMQKIRAQRLSVSLAGSNITYGMPVGYGQAGGHPPAQAKSSRATSGGKTEGVFPRAASLHNCGGVNLQPLGAQDAARRRQQ